MKRILLGFLLLSVLIVPVYAQATKEVVAKEPTVSLHFKGVSIRNALLQVAKEANFNLLGGTDITGKVTISLADVPVSQALKAILEDSGYTYKREPGNILKIIPSANPPKRIDVGKGAYIQVFSVNYSDPVYIKETILPLLPKGTDLKVPEGSNKLFVKGSLYSLGAVTKFLRVLDRPPKQVMVEARVLEITHTSSNILGTQGQYTRPSDAGDYIKEVGLAGSPTDAGAQGMFLGVSSQGLTALVEAFRSKTGYNLLSAPKVLAVSGKSAEIITGSRLGYKVKTVTPTGLIESVEFMDVGTKLNIKPIVKDDNTIIMEIHPEVSTGSIINELPQKDSTETTTTLSVKSGQSIIIGGLIRDYVQEVQIGTPILMDIPLIGSFFRRTVTDTQKREIVVLISPHIVDVAQIEQDAKQYEAFTKHQQKSENFNYFQMIR